MREECSDVYAVMLYVAIVLSVTSKGDHTRGNFFKQQVAYDKVIKFPVYVAMSTVAGDILQNRKGVYSERQVASNFKGITTPIMK